MPEVRPIRERELLIDDELRHGIRRKVDPLINYALQARGYTEEHTPAGRIILDGRTVQPSMAYELHFDSSPFHGLSVNTTHEIYGRERNLTKAALKLFRVGGFKVPSLVKDGDRYYTSTISPEDQNKEPKQFALSEAEAQDILQDTRAHTHLGYSSSDVPIPVSEGFEELEALHAARNVDRRAHYQMLTSPDHGDIQLNIGESFESRIIEVGGQKRQRKFNTKKMFELMARQPLDNGTLLLGFHYRSGKKDKDTELKITATIEGTDYSDERKDALYREMIDNYQEFDPSKFGRGVISNLQKILDTDSNIIRLG